MRSPAMCEVEREVAPARQRHGGVCERRSFTERILALFDNCIWLTLIFMISCLQVCARHATPF